MLIEAICQECLKYDGKSIVVKKWWYCWADYDKNKKEKCLVGTKWPIPKFCVMELEQLMATQEAVLT